MSTMSAEITPANDDYGPLFARLVRGAMVLPNVECAIKLLTVEGTAAAFEYKHPTPDVLAGASMR
jgi:hypothetical protein